MRSKLATLFLTTLAAGSCLLATAAPASASASDVGKRKWISSQHGWQRTGVFVEAGDLVQVYHVSGWWTVDRRKFPYVTSRGYPWSIDRQIYQGCKILNNQTYGTLIAKLNGHVFKIGRSASYRVHEEGFLELRINDADRCLGDNKGAVRVKVAVIDEG